MTLTLLLGGARSGKSALAVRMAAAWEGPVCIVATATAGDNEMAARIERHRRERPAEWTVVEEPLALADALRGVGDAFVVVECLTLWVSNLLRDGRSDGEIEDAARAAAELASSREAPTVVVSNEVGMGVVPSTELGRTYRDLLGRVNALFAAWADRTLLVAAGRTLELGPPPA